MGVCVCGPWFVILMPKNKHYLASVSPALPSRLILPVPAMLGLHVPFGCFPAVSEFWGASAAL